MTLSRKCLICGREICDILSCSRIAREQYFEKLKQANSRWQTKTNIAHDELERHLARIGVPTKILQSLRNTQLTGPLEWARRFDSGHKEKLLLGLIGSPGSGKSVAAGWILQETCRRYPWNSQATGMAAEPAAWIAASDLTSYSAFEHVDQERLRYLERISLLVIDDCGDEATKYGAGMLANLVKNRHAGTRRTVLTSNLTMSGFREKYGQEVLDRIRGDGFLPDLSAHKSRRNSQSEAR